MKIILKISFCYIFFFLFWEREYFLISDWNKFKWYKNQRGFDIFFGKYCILNLMIRTQIQNRVRIRIEWIRISTLSTKNEISPYISMSFVGTFNCKRYFFDKFLTCILSYWLPFFTKGNCTARVLRFLCSKHLTWKGIIVTLRYLHN